MRIPLTVLPDPTDPRGLQPWVHAVVDGEPVRLILDSGARTTSLPHTGSIAALPTLGTSEGRGASGQVGGDPIIRVGTLTAGDLTVHDLTATRDPQDWPHPGLLGLDALPGIWHLDLAGELLELDGPPRTVPWQDHSGDRPKVPLQWKNSRVGALWDTGASLTVVDRSWAVEHADAVQIGEEGAPGTDSTGTQIPSADGELAPFTCGGHAIAGGPCVVVNLSDLNQHLTEPIHVILGLPQMLELEWWFDLAGQRWAVTAPGASVDG